MDLIVLNRQQKQRAAKVFYQSFFNYPQMVYYFPDAKVRERYLEWYLGCVIAYALRYGEVHANAEISGFACWIPPGQTANSLWGAVRTGFLLAPFRFGLRDYQRLLECEDYTNRVHKQIMPDPHYYVWGVGVVPGLQGKGLGTQLLQPGLEKARQEGFPVYLETHDAQNIRFYEKLGFSLVREDRVPKHNLPFWCFVKG